MDQQLLKITYHLADKKMSAYLKVQFAQMIEAVKKDIELYLFEERKQPRCEIRFYWIDDDGDEIDIVNQKDFDIFLNKRMDSQHLHVAPVNIPITVETPNPQKEETSGASAPQTQIPPADEKNENRVHLNVECDSCLMAPIIGFRYKCIQCPNYDLCQNCEAKHVHAEHMMVRMPNNGCPYVVDAFITNGRKMSRKHEKRCKSGESPRRPCGFAYASTSAGSAPAGNGEKSSKVSAEQSDATGKDRHHGRRHRRHVRHNFLSHLYEMMHDLAEGGGADANAAAMGTGDGLVATETTTTTSGMCGNNNAEIIANAYAAAENAHGVAAKTAEILAKVAQQTPVPCAGVSTGTSVNTTANLNTEPIIGKVFPTTSPHVPEPSAPEVPVIPIPSPSLENLAQFLNPQYMKTGIEILNNFSDMFAKMLDPVDGAQGEDSPSTSSCPFDPMMRKSSTASTQSTNSKKSNDSVKSNDSTQKSKQNENENVHATKDAEKIDDGNKKNVSNNSLVDILDLGSDSESDGVSEGFVKLNAPTKENTPEKAAEVSATGSTAASPMVSKGSTPPQSLNKSNVMDFAQLSADLKAHIAQEQQNNLVTSEKEKANMAATAPVIEMRAVPVFNTTTNTSSTAPSNGEPKKRDEEPRVPVYHADDRINSSVRAMMSMGFANEGAMLTQLLESVNGNISEAIDIILATQR